MEGKVWLVGAGPGRADLLTIKGERLIKEADVVLYDRLVDLSVLLLIGEQAECIDVGKCSGYHKMSQEEINELLCEKALEGKRVVRLKGGDPFVFGRGEEEAAYLKKRNISYEVVPGITSAVAVPECVGIPVTARGISSGFYVVTAHHRKQERAGIDYPALAALKGTTLVFLMGIGKIEEIVRGLIKAGKDPLCPAAVIHSGVTFRQKAVYAPLQQLAKEAKEAEITPPGIILVGEVCGIRKEDRGGCGYKTCKRRRVIVTRPKEKNKRLIELLRNEYVEVVEQPMIAIHKLEAGARIKRLIEDSSPIIVVFTSEPAVRFFFEEIKKQERDLRMLAHMEFAVIGEKTKEALRKYGVIERICPDKPYGMELGRELLQFVLKQKKMHKIVVATPDNKESECYGYLKSHAGEEVSIMALPLYRTDLVTARFFDWNKEDLVTFTSASCVDGFVQNMERAAQNMAGGIPMTKEELLRQVQAVCIGRTTLNRALRYHMNAVMSKEVTMESMVQCVLDLI